PFFMHHLGPAGRRRGFGLGNGPFLVLGNISRGRQGDDGARARGQIGIVEIGNGLARNVSASHVVVVGMLPVEAGMGSVVLPIVAGEPVASGSEKGDAVVGGQIPEVVSVYERTDGTYASSQIHREIHGHLSQNRSPAEYRHARRHLEAHLSETHFHSLQKNTVILYFRTGDLSDGLWGRPKSGGKTPAQADGIGMAGATR